MSTKFNIKNYYLFAKLHRFIDRRNCFWIKYNSKEYIKNLV